ncbi:hypothetical protein LY78DRAFT_682089 [Colletotrichum sublineola]|nr:hypothetical protein LY78DRAFT_682089 [Colletotrichum sublineola]
MKPDYTDLLHPSHPITPYSPNQTPIPHVLTLRGHLRHLLILFIQPPNLLANLKCRSNPTSNKNDDSGDHGGDDQERDHDSVVCLIPLLPAASWVSVSTTEVVLVVYPRALPPPALVLRVAVPEACVSAVVVVRLRVMCPADRSGVGSGHIGGLVRRFGKRGAAKRTMPANKPR